MVITSTSVLKKLLVLFLVIGGLYYSKDFLMPLCIGGVLATLLLPLCRWLQKKKLPKGLAALICLLTIIGFIAGIGFILGWQISGLSQDIALIKQKLFSTVTRVQDFVAQQLGIPEKKQLQLLKDNQPSLGGAMKTVIDSFARTLTYFVIILAYIFLLLYYRSHIRQFLLKLSPPSQQEEMDFVISRTGQVSQQYLLGLIKIIACLWVMYGIGFSILGVPNALFFAFLCGLFEIVPYIGNLTGTTLTLLVSAGHGAEAPMLLGIAGTYGAIQFIQGWLLEPIILGPQVKINPLFTVLALVIGELIWGIPGIFLAIPLTGMFKIVCDHIDSLKPLGFALGETESKKREHPVMRSIIDSIKRWRRK